MGFSVFVEMINLRVRKKAHPAHPVELRRRYKDTPQQTSVEG